MDYRKLNVVTKSEKFPLPFTESILETVAGHEIYSLMDGFSGYNQVQIAPEDQLKTCFIMGKYRMGSIRISNNVLWVDECANNLSKSSNGDICGVLR